MAKKKQIPVKVDKAEAQLKDFFDMIAPSAVKFMADHFIFGDTYRCVWAIREYPPQTSDQAILSRFGDKENVTLHIYSRYVDAAEQRKILQNEPDMFIPQPCLLRLRKSCYTQFRYAIAHGKRQQVFA